jgi:glycogen debranching enzyme
MSQTLIDKAYDKALAVLNACAQPTGFYASGLKDGYEATWSRDSNITALGASLVGNKFQTTIKKSLELLAKHQSENGQIPNCVGSYNIERKSAITFNSIDSSLWFIIGHFVYTQAYNDTDLLEKHRQHLLKALMWLKFQDTNEDKILVQQPTMDWMDAFPHKYGRVINTQALYYLTLRLIGDNKLSTRIKMVTNGEIEKYLALYDDKLGYYRPWVWKDHNGDRESEEWFDTLGNLLAIVSGMATPKIAQNILDYIDKHEINRPYPCKCIWPPIKPEDKEWHSYFAKCDAREPLHYLNAGIWPFIGGFYIVALLKTGQTKKARIELENLAQSVLQGVKLRPEMDKPYEFNEWLHGAQGDPRGEPYQAWSAGSYIYAYECVKQEKVIFFE